MAEPRVYRLQRNGEDLGAPPETDEAILLFAADSIGCRLSGDWGGKAITVDRGGVVFIGTPPREVRTQDGATLSSDHDVVLSRVTASGRLQLGAGIVIEELAAEDASVTAISGSKTATVNRVTGSATFIGPGTFHVQSASRLVLDTADVELHSGRCTDSTIEGLGTVIVRAADGLHIDGPDLVVKGTARRVSGDAVVTCHGSLETDEKFLPRSFDDVHGGAISGMSILNLRWVHLVPLSDAREFRPFVPDRDRLNEAVATDPEAQSCVRFWAQMVRLLAEHDAPGADQSRVREAADRARLRVATGAEKWLLRMARAIGFGERIGRPLAITAAVALLFGLVLRVPGHWYPQEGFWSAWLKATMSAVAAPLGLLKVTAPTGELERVRSSGSTMGVWPYEAAKLIESTLIAASLLAAKRTFRPPRK